jgi:hypothetical protein
VRHRAGVHPTEVLHRPGCDVEPRAVHAILTQIRAGSEHVTAGPLAVVQPM